MLADYLAALESGDVERALELAPADDSEGSTALLTEEVYLSAHSRRLDCAEPQGATDASDTATASCTNEVGAPFSIRFEREGSSWRITHGAQQLVSAVDSPLPVSTIGGVEVPASVADGTESAWLLPGSYTLGTADDVRGDVDVGGSTWFGGDGAYAWVVGAAGPSMIEAAGALAESHVASCAEHGGEACAGIDPASASTSWTVVVTGETTRHNDVTVDDDIHIGVHVQRLEDGVPVAAHFVVVTAQLDGEEGSLEVEPDPMAYIS